MSRGMKQYLPFKSLHEQSDVLHYLFYCHHKVEKPILSPDQVGEIDDFLHAYCGEKIEITYFDDGYIKRIEAKIQRIDTVNQKLVSSVKTIDFTNILKLEKI